jgi:hypothetical protein
MMVTDPFDRWRTIAICGKSVKSKNTSHKGTKDTRNYMGIVLASESPTPEIKE